MGGIVTVLFYLFFCLTPHGERTIVAVKNKEKEKLNFVYVRNRQFRKSSVLVD